MNTTPLTMLEHKHMLSYGTILAMDTILCALIATHPDRKALLEAVDILHARNNQLFHQTVMMTDDVSEHVTTTHKQFERMMTSYKNGILKDTGGE